MLQNVSWTEARDLLTGLARPTGTETVPLDACGGRVLAFDLCAEEDVPPFDRSAYDGYAFRSEDTLQASREHPAVMRITETIPAGSLAALPVTAGTAAHLMTGARLPEGADCVINFERTAFTPDTVTLFQPLAPWDNVVRRGEDVRKGTLLAPCGTVIDAGLAGTLAAQGVSEPCVFRLPVIGLISTGSEVVEAGEPQGEGMIRNANRASLTALLTREGCLVRYLGLAGDDAGEIGRLIAGGLDSCDAVILTGGVSVGDWDVTPEAMQRAGCEILLRGVHMKPGMACAYGSRDGKLVLGLSGNPASALTHLCVCALSALRKMRGMRDTDPAPFRAALRDGFRKKSPSDRFLRGHLDLSGAALTFTGGGSQGNAVLSSTIGCEAFLLIPGGSGPVAPGEVLSGFSLK